MLDLELKKTKGKILIFSCYSSRSPYADSLVSLGLGKP